VIHRASDGSYGVPRITAELGEDGEVVNHKRVVRVMEAIGLGRSQPAQEASHHHPGPGRRRRCRI
jgi:helix-turn-helix protein